MNEPHMVIPLLVFKRWPYPRATLYCSYDTMTTNQYPWKLWRKREWRNRLDWTGQISQDCSKVVQHIVTDCWWKSDNNTSGYLPLTTSTPSQTLLMSDLFSRRTVTDLIMYSCGELKTPSSLPLLLLFLLLPFFPPFFPPPPPAQLFKIGPLAPKKNRAERVFLTLRFAQF